MGLKNGPLAAAGLDVINGEWKDDLADHPLIRYARSHGNLFITPHVGGATYESKDMALSAAAVKLADHLAATMKR
jgi:phosphoglycerate dehydrogenase-like enzyme